MYVKSINTNKYIHKYIQNLNKIKRQKEKKRKTTLNNTKLNNPSNG